MFLFGDEIAHEDVAGAVRVARDDLGAAESNAT